MKESFKNSMKDFIESHELNDKQVDELNSLLKDNRSSSRSVWVFSALASVAVISIALSILINQGLLYKTESSLLIAKEVAKNHLKLKPLEVRGASLGEISSYFSALDFSLGQSQYIDSNNLELIGGRYCSIQGIAAAQLRMKKDGSDDVQIVYQAPYNQELFRDLPELQDGKTPIRHYINGIAVDVWVENGILYARSFKP